VKGAWGIEEAGVGVRKGSEGEMRELREDGRMKGDGGVQAE
jgi:hypothetical protein